MFLMAIGVNHQTAPVRIRERIAFSPARLKDALTMLKDIACLRGAAILSTCNRTEVYCEADDINSDAIIHWLEEYHQLEQSEITPFLYQHPGPDAVRHLLRVASGLDSLILGEPQILGQIKKAYQEAGDAGTLGSLLERLFQHTFTVAKQVRTDTEIGSSPVSVAFAAVSLAKQIFGDLSKQTALLIGAGETIELTARHLSDNGIQRLIIANRSIDKAQALACEFDAYAISLDQIPTHLAEADIVISSTASVTPIVHKPMVKAALKKRKHRPMFMVDIAVPRDIDEDVSTLSDIYLYTVDDLQEVIDENMHSRQEAAKQAEEIIEVQVSHFMGWLRSLDSVALIQKYRDQNIQISQQTLAKALRLLSQGTPPEQALEYLAHTLTNKIMHHPTVQIKHAGYQGDAELLRTAEAFLIHSKSHSDDHET